MGQADVGAQVSVLPVDRDKVLGPGDVEDQLQLLLARVPVDVDQGDPVVEDLCSQAE